MLPTTAIAAIDGFSVVLGNHHYLFRYSETPFNNSLSAAITADKYCTNAMLRAAGIPVPQSIPLDKDDFQAGKLAEKIAHLRFPLVIKPLFNGLMGNGVLCNIKTFAQLTTLLTTHFELFDHLLIEEFYGQLKSYRVLVFNQRVIGVVRRYPASVVGDGQHTIRELIAQTNQERQKISDTLGLIAIDEECLIRLQEQGLTSESIPDNGQRIVLCYTSNATRGGLYKSLGRKICNENKAIMIKAARLLNLTLAGIDVECSDINVPIQASRGVIIEVNYKPSIRIHETPIKGIPIRVTRIMMRWFICRHPYAYLRALYKHQQLAFYIRLLLLLCPLMLCYRLFM